MLTNDSWLDREQRELLLQEPDECIAVFGDFIRYVVICWTEYSESCYFRSRTNVSLSLVTSSGIDIINYLHSNGGSRTGLCKTITPSGCYFQQ